MAKNRIASIASELAEPVLSEMGYELVDTIYRYEQKIGWYLYISIDKPGGINITDCEKVAKVLDPLFDDCDDIRDKHDHLSVQSPGLDRPIVTMRDFHRRLGDELDVTLFIPINGLKKYSAILESFDENNICLNCKGKLITIPRNKIAKAVIAIKF